MHAFYFVVEEHIWTLVVCIFHFMIKISITIRFKRKWMIQVHPWLNHTCTRELKARCTTHGGLNRWWNNRSMDDCEECSFKIGSSLWCKLSHVRHSGEVFISCSLIGHSWWTLTSQSNQGFSSFPLFDNPDGFG